jgi:hypothetical protein
MQNAEAKPQSRLSRTAETAEGIRQNLEAVQTRIEAACRRAGRNPAAVRLLPVSKAVPTERIRLAYTAGCRFLGENKVQEALLKAEALADLPDLKWSVIGHLPSNKTKYLARFAHELQSLDSLKVAAALDRRLQIEGRGLDVLVQVNSSGEAGKSGVAAGDLLDFVRQLPAFSALRVRGLMTLAIESPEQARVRQCFTVMRDLRERLRQDAPEPLSFDELSMGMSGDYELAIEEGSTVLRIGRAIFGRRPVTPLPHQI